MNMRYNTPPSDREAMDFLRKKKEEYRARGEFFTISQAKTCLDISYNIPQEQALAILDRIGYLLDLD